MVNNSSMRSSDWFYVPGVLPSRLEGKLRHSYMMWKERVPPLIVIEFVSGYYDDNSRTAQLLTVLILRLGGHETKGLYSFLRGVFNFFILNLRVRIPIRRALLMVPWTECNPSPPDPSFLRSLRPIS